MDRKQALEHIDAALRAAKNDSQVSAKPGTDLMEEGILDSLDALVFFMELGTSTGKEFPEKDLQELGFFKVDKLIQFISAE